MMGWIPRCYIPGFVEIGLSVLEKISKGFFTIYGHSSHLGYVTIIMSSDFHFLVPESFQTKFGSDQHSGFSENPVQIFICTQLWAKVKK